MKKAFSAMKGRRVRVTQLDACGRTVFGDSSYGVSKGFITAAWTANTITSDEVSQTNASGERCVHEPAETELTGYSLNITFCEVDPELFSLITGQEVYLDDNGDPIGFSINTKISLSGRGFALEIWAGAPAGDACDDPNAEGSYGYFLAPFLKGGYVSDYTVENGAVTFTITGATTRDGNRWGVGPYNVMMNGGVPGPLVTPLDPNDHKLLIWVSVAPPEVFYGARPLLDPNSTAITAIATAKGANNSTTTFTFTGAGSNPVLVEYGDGEWEYIPVGSTGATHVYADNGNYTARATTNGTWVTKAVTIPWP